MDAVTDFYMERNQSPKPPLGSVLPPVSDILTPRTLGQVSRWCCRAWQQNATQTEMFVGQSALTELQIVKNFASDAAGQPEARWGLRTSYSTSHLKLNMCPSIGAAARKKDLEKCDVCAVRLCADSAFFCVNSSFHRFWINQQGQEALPPPPALNWLLELKLRPKRVKSSVAWWIYSSSLYLHKVKCFINRRNYCCWTLRPRQSLTRVTNDLWLYVIYEC